MVNEYSNLSERDKQVTLLEKMDAAKTAIENMPTGGGPIEYVVDENGKMSNATVNFKLPSNAKDLGSYTFYHALTNNSTIRTADLSSLTTISESYGAGYMFYGDSRLTSADLSSLTTVSGGNGASYMFSGCSSLASADLSSLTTVSGGNGVSYMFSGCSSLTSVDLSSLTTIAGNNGCCFMFSGCSGLTSVDLSSLTNIGVGNAVSNMFKGCTSLKELRFPALTADSFGSYSTQFSNMLNGVTGCTVHFPVATQEKIRSMSAFPNFGGISTTVLFDL